MERLSKMPKVKQLNWDANPSWSELKDHAIQAATPTPLPHVVA